MTRLNEGLRREIAMRTEVEPLRHRWRTPERILQRVRLTFERGSYTMRLLSSVKPIAFDPATEPDNPTDAVAFETRVTDGLRENLIWPKYRVFLNPPFDRIEQWVERFVARVDLGFCITPLGLETKWARRFVGRGATLLVPPFRIAYEPPPGVEASTPRMPTGLWYIGPASAIKEPFEGWSHYYTRTL